MNENSNVVPLRQPDEIDDPLTNIFAIWCAGAACAGCRDGSRGISRRDEGHEASRRPRPPWCGTGHGPVRTIQTGIGAVEVARVKNSGSRGAPAMASGFASRRRILPLWARRTRSLDALLPVLYLRGISTGDFQEALAALLGKDAQNLLRR